MRKPEFTGVSEVERGDGERVRVNFAGYPQIVTSQQMVLGVAVQTVRATGRSTPGVARNAAPADLSGRKREVIEMIASGLSGPEIAQELHLTHNTVRTHVRNSMAKTAGAVASESCRHVAGHGVAMG